MSIYLLRHAEVSPRYKGRYYGSLDMPISEVGISQAKAIAKELSCIKFDKIYSSNLLRAKQTLSFIKTDADVIYTPLLQEKSWGKHEGMSFDEIVDSGIEYKDFTQWISALDGESLDEFLSRVKEYFFKEIYPKKDRDILVVTHGGVIKIILQELQGLSLQDAFSISIDYANYIKI